MGYMFFLTTSNFSFAPVTMLLLLLSWDTNRNRFSSRNGREISSSKKGTTRLGQLYIRFLEEQAILPNQVILIKICSTNRKSGLQISDMIVLVHRDFSKNGNFSALLRTVLYSALSYSGCAQDDQYLASCAPGVATHHWPPQSCWCSAVDDDSDNILIIWENNQHVVQAVWRRFGGGRP